MCPYFSKNSRFVESHFVSCPYPYFLGYNLQQTIFEQQYTPKLTSYTDTKSTSNSSAK